MRRLTAWSLVVLGVTALIVAWSRIDWAWSPVDDAGHVLALRSRQEELGFLAGIIAYARDMAVFDGSWGLFRPSYWVATPVQYLLDPAGARLLRLALLVLAVAGPVVALRRMRLTGATLAAAACLVAAGTSALWIGVFLPSLQELSGAALVGIGLAVRGSKGRWVAWTLAAWFKSPFAWLLIGQAFVEWRSGHRRAAFAYGATGAGTLAIAALMSFRGSYTGDYRLELARIVFNAERLLEPQNSLLLVVFIAWLLASGGGARLNALSITAFIGFGGYALQLLPWTTGAYYGGPVTYLLALGLASTLVPPVRQLSARRAITALILPVTLSAHLLALPLIQGLRMNSIMAGIQRCLQPISAGTFVIEGSLPYVTTSPEAPIRMVQGLQLVDMNWVGTIEQAGGTEARATYRITVGERDLSDSGQVRCAFWGGEVRSNQ